MSKEINCVYVITYTGDPETNVEGWIADEKDFSKWLDYHNQKRWEEDACGNSEERWEGEDEEYEEHMNKECGCIELEHNFEIEPLYRLSISKEEDE